MACTKYTLEQYNTLNAAIAIGALKVKYGDKDVEYRNLDDMIRLQGLMEACLFPTNNNNTARRFVNFSKGTDGCSKRRRFL